MTTKKFGLKNLDCAACAAKLENGLNDMETIDKAVVDFATMTLFITAEDVADIEAKVKVIEPEVGIIDYSNLPASSEAAQEESDKPRDLILLAVAGAMFIFTLVYEDVFHQTKWSGWEVPFVLVAYFLAGWNVLLGALKTIKKGLFFDENVLMTIATIGAIAIHAYPEAVGIMIFFKVGELLQGFAVNRSRRSIKSLLASRPDKAFLLELDGLKEVKPEMVQVGQSVVVKPGDKIPLDGEVTSGSSQIDTSALTGESVPIVVEEGDSVLAGQICKTGALTIKVTRPFEESSIAKVMDLVENATANKAKTEKFITRFSRYYTPFVVFLAAGIALIPPLFMGASFSEWIYRALVLLVISCPCALVVSIPLGYFGGIGRSSMQGILVKGSNYLDVLASVTTVAFDKTGTLTEGVFKVNDVVTNNGFTKDSLIEFAAAAEYHSTHPIAVSIVDIQNAKGEPVQESKISEHTVRSGMGVEAVYEGHRVLVGNNRLMEKNGVEYQNKNYEGTIAHVSVDGKYAGHIAIGDNLRSDARQAIRSLKDMGVKEVVMLTGDNEQTAAAVAKTLGLDSFHANLLPEDKVDYFEKINSNNRDSGKIAFVGDGINDAPVIARADVGIAMGAMGSDAAVETADVVLMVDSPLKVAEAISIAKQTRRIVWQNILLAFVVKGIFISFGAFGLATMWEAVFADVGTALLALANSARILKS
ncbi:heavy metal translocating P-type ATPase [Pseudodesulfovibrio indicus]|jgi:Cd2+/Zn2+-exporting ATPase|uniref:P-type Zn(2+) transporter n=1 Tax=Pseudodesulfovibrio indicus TaxID=1716143 RepID=A0A126QMR5_9BACT|nr:heavy metal translocating P-type ATPase [Pseudodesulfovibrio indicus]AMK11252.1 metal-transporting ATPase [Pseudodesulfovibrio indicus]TDT92282.1 Cd2+/Zn2+-exporting ATPase [Pseudodesulfovibrio indicus]